MNMNTNENYMIQNFIVKSRAPVAILSVENRSKICNNKASRVNKWPMTITLTGLPIMDILSSVIKVMAQVSKWVLRGPCLVPNILLKSLLQINVMGYELWTIENTDLEAEHNRRK